MTIEHEIKGPFTVVTTWELDKKGVPKKLATPYECYLTGTEATEASNNYWRAHGFAGRP